MSELCGIIMAAGEGKRFSSPLPKVLFEVLNKPMLYWVSDSLEEADIKDICVIKGYEYQKIDESLKLNSKNYSTALQSERLGTGHAVLQAKEFLKKNIDSYVFICAGDSPFISKNSIKNSLNMLKENDLSCVILSAKVSNPFGYGRIIRENNLVKAIIEEKDLSDDLKSLNEINSSSYWFKTSHLLEVLDKIKSDNNQKEYYLTDAISLLVSENKKVGAYTVGDSFEVLGANNRAQLLELNDLIKKVIINKHLDNGVEFITTEGVVIGPDVKIGKGTKIMPSTILTGNTVVGENCVIGPFSTANNVVFGNNVKFNACQGVDSTIGDNTAIGPYTQLRPNSHLGCNMKIGNFVEIKNSTLGNGSKVPHLTYVGDSDVGEKVNFGCGSVTVNYDGEKKHRTKVGNNVFIGCNTNLVAPVTLEDNTYTAAGSTICEDVKEYDLAIARAKQVNKHGWVLKRKDGKK